MADVIVPKTGMYEEDVRLATWLKAEGDDVASGDSLLEFETDKATAEVEAESDGILHQLVAAGEMVPIGTVVARVVASREEYDALRAPPGGPEAAGPADDSADEPPAAQSELFLDYLRKGVTDVGPGETATESVQAAPAVRSLRRPGGQRPISPRARAALATHGITVAEIAAIPISGVRVVERDVLAYLETRRGTPAAAPAPAPAPVDPGGPLAGRRRLIAQRMVRSLQTSAQLTSVLELDVTRLVRWRAASAPELGFAAIFAFLATRALQRHPGLNATLEDDVLRVHAEVDLAIAVHTEAGVIAPVIRDAGRLDLATIGERIRDLAARARADILDLDDLTGGSFTLSSGGAGRVDITTAILNPPQVAILWVGRVRQRPVVVDGALAVGETVHACLTYDHRVIDGAPAADFLGTFEDLANSIEHHI